MKTNQQGEKMKNREKIEEILKSIIPNNYIDIKTEYNWNYFQISAICEIEKQVAEEFKKKPRRQIWFCFWSDIDKWHISLDGTRAYDYLSYESEFGQNEDMINKICSLLNTHNLDWNNHYSFNIK